MNNVAVRSISGVVFILAMLACLMFNKFLFAGLIIFIMSVMLLEFYHITMGNSYTFSKVLAIIAAIFLFGLLFATASYHIPIRFVAFAMVPIFIVMINSLYVKDKDEYGKFSNIYTGLLYIAVPIALSNLIAFDKAGNFSGNLLLCFFIIIWCSDVGAFAFGISLGKIFPQKLFPSVSPKKTWIGFIGGLVSSIDRPERHRHQRAVEPVQKASVSRDDFSRVLDSVHSFPLRLKQVAIDSGHGHYK